MRQDTPVNVRMAVLGPVLIEGPEGRLVEPSGAKAKSLLVSLAMTKGAVVSPSRLIEDVWSDAPPPSKAALHTLVSRTRSACAEGLLATHAGGYQLHLEGSEIDVFAAADAEARARTLIEEGRYGKAAGEAEAALALWRSDPDPQLSPALSEDLLAVSAPLRESLLRLRAQALVETARFEEAFESLEPLGALHPLDETVQALLIRAQHAMGQTAAAMERFDRTRRRLRETLGLSPSPELVQAHRVMLDDDRAPDGAGARPGRQQQIGLRVAPNPLLGRDADLAALEQMMSSARLTTILGAGGLGKTRLAQELGRRSAVAGTPSVVVIELASVRSPDDVILAFASTLGIREPSAKQQIAVSAAAPRMLARIAARLGERRTLLIVDNCEHVLDEAARIVAELLADVEGLTALATSRAPLGISAEHVYQLDPLASSVAEGLGDEVPPAVELFRERAQAARPGVVLRDEAIAALCESLDGLPLAIELAAAKVRTMTVEEIARRLSRRFALLTSGDRSGPARHQTLWAVIDWSWNLLGESERAVLRRLSRFPDGFTASAAMAVANPAGGPIDVESALANLVNQSLVNVREDSGGVRYRMLETVREFGDMALIEAAEDGEVTGALVRWAADFALAQAPLASGPTQVEALCRIRLEEDNLLSALRWAIDARSAAEVLSIFALLGLYWSIRGAHTEVAAFAPDVMAASGHYEPEPRTSDAAAFAYCLLGATAFFTGIRTAVTARSRLKRLLRSGFPIEPWTRAMASLVIAVNDAAAFRAVLQECRRSPDPGTRAFGHLLTAQMAENEGDADAAVAAGLEVHRLGLQARDPWIVSMAEQTLAQLYSQLARPREALRWGATAIEGLMTLQADVDVTQLRWMFASAQVAAGLTAEARETIEDLFAGLDGEPTGETALTIGACLAEADLVEGEIEKGLAGLRRLFTETPAAALRRSPWGLVVGAQMLGAHVLHGYGLHGYGLQGDGLPVDEDSERLAAWARRIRVGLRVSSRVSPYFTDKPVSGTVVLALGSWLLSPQYRDRALASRDAGLERAVEAGWRLLVLAERMSSRQDYPSLQRGPHRELAERTHGPEGWGRAVLAIDSSPVPPASSAARPAPGTGDPAAGPSRAEAAARRAFELLAEPSLWAAGPAAG